MTKFTCIECIHNYKSLTREGLCAFCYLNKYKVWAKKFTDIGLKHADGEN